MERKGLLEIFATHPVAMNVLMLIIVGLGIAALNRINFQFFPTFALPFATVETTWPGASSEDVEQSITNRLELDLKNMDNLKFISSHSRSGKSRIILEFNDGADIGGAVDDAKQIVNLAASSLPEDAELPEVIQVDQFEPIATLIVTAEHTDQLRTVAHRYREELLASGIGKIDISGLPDEEISILISSERLRELQMNLKQVGERIRAASLDAPVGILGRDDAARQLRFVQQRRSQIAFEDIPIVADENGSLIKLGDIADIKRRPKSDQVFVRFQGRPAALLGLKRSQSADTLKSTQILYDWIEMRTATIPPSVSLFIHDDRSIALRGRFDVLLKNGAAGLLLVLGVLFVFLNMRLALWVAAGIPVSILGAAGLLYLFGGSLNMVTMFAFIMTLGIIVDDAIVVGEDALRRFKQGSSSADSVQRASRHMFLPIIAASATTIFAFTPVAIVPGIMGSIMSSLGLVVVCVVTLSVIEAFFILPGHLNHSFKRIRGKEPSRFSQAFDNLYSRFRDGIFTDLLTASINRPVLTMSTAVAALILTVGLISSGRLQYTFFPTPELDRIFANVSFVAGTPRDEIDRFLSHAEQELLETEQELGEGLISSYFIRHGAIVGANESQINGNQHGSIVVELIGADTREVRVTQFLRHWEDKLELVPGLENLIVFTPSAGPGGSDIEIYFSGEEPGTVKRAAVEFTEHLRSLDGVYGVKDDTSYGYQQRVMSLTSKGKALGLTVSEISRQLRSGIEGDALQSFTSKLDEIDVVPKLPDAERNFLGAMENISITLASGRSVPLSDVVTFEWDRGFDTLYHKNGTFSIEVTGEVDAASNNAREVLADLEADTLPKIVEKYGVEWVYGSSTVEQAETEQAMQLGAAIALLMIYLTLTWVFGSYVWPILVMVTIPFGIVGAAWGHYILGLQISIITIFGLIGLSGIVVNNAIVLIVRYKQNLAQGMESKSAMIEASKRRLRPVVLSSVTTVVGLMPLLFEKSTQAQFLIPMAVSISFGLAFSTVLVLVIVPALVTSFETLRERVGRLMSSDSAHPGDDVAETPR